MLDRGLTKPQVRELVLSEALQREMESLRLELAGLKLSGLRKRALALGVAEASLDDAEEGEVIISPPSGGGGGINRRTPRNAIVALVMEHMRGQIQPPVHLRRQQAEAGGGDDYIGNLFEAFDADGSGRMSEAE